MRGEELARWLQKKKAWRSNQAALHGILQLLPKNAFYLRLKRCLRS